MQDNKSLEEMLNAERCGSQALRAKMVEQAAAIERLRDALYRIATYRTGQCTDLAQELFDREDWATEALSSTTDSKQILADWMREQLGEPAAWVEEGIFMANPFSRKRIKLENPKGVQTPLFKLPECLK